MTHALLPHTPTGTQVLRLFYAINTQTTTLGFFAPHFGQLPLIPAFVVHVKLVCGVPAKSLWDNASKKSCGLVEFLSLNFGKLEVIISRLKEIHPCGKENSLLMATGLETRNLPVNSESPAHRRRSQVCTHLPPSQERG